MKENISKYIAEFIGTFALVFCGTGAIIVNQQSNGSLGLLGIAIAFGLIITSVIYIFGNISGAHINPAVTIALWIGRYMPRKDVFFYLLFQVLGAFAGSLLLKYLFPNDITLGATIPSGEIAQAFIMELVTTFFLMLTILGITSQKSESTKSLAGLVIGFAVISLILISGPVSGGSFNPARSLAPSVVSGNTSTLWVYLIAPTLGAIIASLLWRIMNSRKTDSI